MSRPEVVECDSEREVVACFASEVDRLAADRERRLEVGSSGCG
jgi:hypothetical protein